MIELYAAHQDEVGELAAPHDAGLLVVLNEHERGAGQHEAVAHDERYDGPPGQHAEQQKRTDQEQKEHAVGDRVEHPAEVALPVVATGQPAVEHVGQRQDEHDDGRRPVAWGARRLYTHRKTGSMHSRAMVMAFGIIRRA